MKRFFVNLAIALLLLTAGHSAFAQGKKKPRASTTTAAALPQVVSEANAPDAPAIGGEVVKAAEIYKTSLRQLLAVREAEATEMAAQLDKLKALYTDGIISKREMDNTEYALVELRHKVEDARKQLNATDVLVVESLAENEAGSVAEFDAAAISGKLVKKVAYIRYRGTAVWSVSDIGKIEKFFTSKFKRPLPVAALGQSDLHNRWGYDHRNAVDVGLHPDTPEGLALMNYLGSQGIPFMAFRRAVPGSSTGPHIHIGQPSQKTAKR